MSPGKLNVVLYQPEIPPNTGNIGRLCYSTGSHLHLIEPLGFSLNDRELKRAGLDYWEHLAFTVWPDWEAFSAFVESAATLYFLSTKASKIYWDASFQEGDYLVFGPETRGLPETLLQKHADTALRIPQTEGRSLNLATSAGIVLYEGLRQLH